MLVVEEIDNLEKEEKEHRPQIQSVWHVRLLTLRYIDTFRTAKRQMSSDIVER